MEPEKTRHAYSNGRDGLPASPMGRNMINRMADKDFFRNGG
jgi:hypothetical protein